MKAFLMYRDRDFDLERALPAHEPALTQDLELNTLFSTMALGDPFLFRVAKKAVLSSLQEPDTILYRQDILKDCLQNPAIVRSIYALALEAIESERKNYWPVTGLSPDSLLRRSLSVLYMFVGKLRQLRNIADEHVGKFVSAGFTAFFAMVQGELGDAYFAEVQDHLRVLEFRPGVLISAALGPGNKGANYVLREPHDKPQRWVEQVFAKKPPAYTFSIGDHDEGGARALAELKDRGINLVANALAQSMDHILSFFTLLRTELAFYVVCLNLQEHLARQGGPICFPAPVAAGERSHRCQGLYDVCLALRLGQGAVGNAVQADDRALVIITGANQGGKSTFLRSIGVAQLMMQCGMFVPAESLRASVCDSLFTHYRREEDASMKSGKLDEELARMSDIVDHVTSDSLVLCNESFAATNEREGAEIARQIVSALLAKGVRVFFVTHLYALAHGFYRQGKVNALFLRAERQSDGTRTFKLSERAPLETSYGEDLYDRIFAREHPAGAAGAV